MKDVMCDSDAPMSLFIFTFDIFHSHKSTPKMVEAICGDFHDQQFNVSPTHQQFLIELAYLQHKK